MPNAENAPSYATASEIKAAMVDANWGDDYDAILSVLAQRASRDIDDACKVHPGYFYATTDELREFEGTNTDMLPIPELATAPTLVQIDTSSDGTYVTVAPTDYVLYPLNALQTGRGYQMLLMRPTAAFTYWPRWFRGIPTVKVTGKWGASLTPPPTIKQLVVIQAARWFKRGQQGFSDTGGVLELGQLRYTKGLDPEVAERVRRYTRLTI